MKNILLPTDFSDNSRNAIKYILALFQDQPCSFHILNVQKTSDFTIDDFYTAPAATSVHETILKDNKQQLKTFVKSLESQINSKHHTIRMYVDFDSLSDAIQQLIEAQEIDLIVMGTNGATGASEVLFGSNTLNVIRKINCPVLVIPEDYTYAGLKSVVFTSNTCRDLKHDGASTLMTLIDIYQPKLHILKIKEKQNGSNHSCTSCLVDTLEGVSYQSHTIRGIPLPMAVDTFVQLHKVDFHAAFVERETFLDRFLFGNTTAKLSYGTRVPLLVLHKE